MSTVLDTDLSFEAANDAAETGQALILDIDGFEGPLHLLLELARMQKVDLARISILELAEQYIAFIKSAQDLRIELAADYLVMASWLAYLKSRLILPRPEGGKLMPEVEEQAGHLAFRLQRLEAMRIAGEALHKLSMTGQQVFVRGAPEGLRSQTTPLYQAKLYDVIKAYGDIRSKATIRNIKLHKPLVLALDEARHRLERALRHSLKWVLFEGLLPHSGEFTEKLPRRSIQASSFLASLELAKEGKLEIRQSKAFAPVYLRSTNQDSKRSRVKNG